MIKVVVYKQSNYPVSTPKLKKKLINFLEEQGIVSDTLVNVSLVGEAKMLDLARKYLNEKNVLHNVLSFPTTEAKTQFPSPPGMIDLGEIIVCFPKAREEASMEGVLVEERVVELVLHGALHLMGVHHK